MNFARALAELDSRGVGRMLPDLSRITALAELMDHPELTYPTIHVTGTNGKTTTSRLITRILCAHGLSTGLYTSPHLESVRERIALCDDSIGEEEFGETYEHLLPFLREVDARGERVTYFETLTALAYLWFAEKPVNAGVFEVGMGGLWDATNLIRGKVCVFTEIALDHPELGSTVEEVAKEKAGILKKGSIAVLEDIGPAALGVIEGRAGEMGLPTYVANHDWRENVDQAVGGQMLTVSIHHSTADDVAQYRHLFVPLHGWFQGIHAATAVVASHVFLGRLDEEAVRAALAGAASPGRLEVVGRHPLVILDGAHNPAGARALVQAIGDEFSWQRLRMVLAVSANKDLDGIAAELARLNPTILATRHSNTGRSSAPHDVAEACRRHGLDDVEQFETVPEALAAAAAHAADDDLILVTGSLYTVADARRALELHG